MLGLLRFVDDDRTLVERRHCERTHVSKSALRHHSDGERHAPMVEAAELGALAAVLTELRRRDVERVVDALDEVSLLEELRHPERVVDVLRAQHEVHRAIDGDLDRRRAHLACTFDDLVLLGELEAPAPLEAGDVDDDCFGRRRRLRDLQLCRDAEPEQCRDDHDRRDRVQHLHRDVVRLLAREVVVLPPEADGGVQDQADDEAEHDEAGDDEPAPQRVDVLALLRDRVGHPEGGNLASSEQGRAREEQRRPSHRPRNLPPAWRRGRADRLTGTSFPHQDGRQSSNP